MVSYDYSEFACEAMRELCERMLQVPDHDDPLASPGIVQSVNFPDDGIDRDADNATVLPTLSECRNHPGTVLDRLRPRPPQADIDAAISVLGANDRQSLACSLLAKSRFVTVQGPPGCGKTHILKLFRVIMSSVTRPGSIGIVCGPTHAAVDNLL